MTSDPDDRLLSLPHFQGLELNPARDGSIAGGEVQRTSGLQTYIYRVAALAVWRLWKQTFLEHILTVRL